jgi:hypothetical protein
MSQILWFCIKLLVRDTPSLGASAFRLYSIPETKNVGIDLYEEDVLYNFVTMDSQLMNGSIPWRGSKEEDLLFLQMLIEDGTPVGDIVVDYTAAICDLLPPNFLVLHSWFFIMQFLWPDCDIYDICKGFHLYLQEGRLPLCGNGRGWDYFQGLVAGANHWQQRQDGDVVELDSDVEVEEEVKLPQVQNKFCT